MWCVFLNACLCGVHVCLLVHVCAPVCVSWSWHWMFSLTTLYFIHWGRVPGWTWNLPIPATLSSQLAQGILVSWLPTEVATMPAWICVGFRDLNPSSYAHVANTLFIESTYKLQENTHIFFFFKKYNKSLLITCTSGNNDYSIQPWLWHGFSA